MGYIGYMTFFWTSEDEVDESGIVGHYILPRENYLFTG